MADLFRGSSLRLLCLLLLLQWSASCTRKPAAPERPQPDTTGLAAMRLTDLFTDSLALEAWITAHPEDSVVAASIREFYYQRTYRFAWLTPQGPGERALAFLNMVRNQDASDLLGESAHWASVAAAVDSLLGGWDPAGKESDPELELTALYFRFTRAVFEGLPEEDLHRLEWYIPRKKVDWVQLLDSAVRGSHSARPWQGPMFHQYERLLKVLARYQAIRAAGGWVSVDASLLGATKGLTDSAVFSLRQRLLQSGDLRDSTMDLRFDDSLALAVRRFRQRHGLSGEMNVDSVTLRLLNLPIDSGIRSLLINLERCRWVPEDPQGPHVVVNIPAFRLYAFSDTGFAWSTRVIVGKTGTATTIFTGTIRTLILNPTWTVPRKIVYEEIIPAMRSNPAYLARNKMELFRSSNLTRAVNPEKVDWEKAGPGNFPYVVRQRSGAWNALGRYKFLFPNSFDIYLHDTPSKQLFERSARTFSHGCIRVAQPEKLARFVLGNDSLWPEERVYSILEKGRETYIPLRRTVPVSIVYFTTWVDEEGFLQEREDVYGHDRRLASVLFGSTITLQTDSSRTNTADTIGGTR